MRVGGGGLGWEAQLGCDDAIVELKRRRNKV